MKVTLMLADSAQVVAGKLYILGGGWSMTGPKLAPFAIAGKIEIPVSEAKQKHSLKLELLDADSKPVLVPTPKGESPLVVSGEFELDHPPSLPKGISIDAPFAFSVKSVLLKPGRQYTWKLTIDSNTKEDWKVTFLTRSTGEKKPVT